MNATCRHWLALSEKLLSYDEPSISKWSAGTSFHSLQATSQALHPMQMLVSVKNPCVAVVVVPGVGSGVQRAEQAVSAGHDFSSSGAAT